MNNDYRDFKDNVAMIQGFSCLYSNTILSFAIMKFYAQMQVHYVAKFYRLNPIELAKEDVILQYTFEHICKNA